jgi:hypothetical protein
MNVVPIALVRDNILVMPGLVPGMTAFFFSGKTWMTGTSPAMTAN